MIFAVVAIKEFDYAYALYKGEDHELDVDVEHADLAMDTIGMIVAVIVFGGLSLAVVGGLIGLVSALT